ncbi:MAG: PASTA domain-containing protein [Ruminococcaceae bacterium]|nr:PASTA domain-containing protein [Oscillospiraceae bacterium]
MVGGTPSTKVRKRASWMCIVFSILFFLLAGKILYIQIFKFDEYEQKVIDQMTQETTVSADRGNIYDTNGIVIATNITTYRLFIDPAAISRQSSADGVNYADIIARGVSEIDTLGITYEDVIAQAGYTKYRDRTLMRHLSEEQADAVRAFIAQKELDDKALVHLQATSKRYYPYDNLASHVLGFTGGDGNGLYGLEMQYDEILSGTDGKYIGAKDSFGNEMVYDYESYIPAIDGYNITTTIDVYIQAELEEQLQTAYVESGGKNRACGIVLDVDTGAVLAMAVYPSYNLNDPWELNYQSAQKLSESGFDEGSDEYNELKQQLLLETWANKAVGELYMPGSTFKVITAAMAYEEHIVKEGETFSCPGYWYPDGVSKIHCHYHKGHGMLTFERGLQQSCNPVLMQMGLRLGAEDYYKYFSAFGYFEKTGIDVSGEAYTSTGVTFWSEKDFLDSPQTTLNLAVASFGQNFKISPIAHISAINAVANGGNLVTPYFVKEITDNEGNVIYSHETEVKRQVISEATAQKVSDILEEGVATDGGSKNAYVAGYRIAAKTGTSEKKDVKDTEYIPYVCSAIAFAPAEAPEISVLFMVDEPTEGVLYASVIAAPYVANLMSEVLPYVGVEAEYTEEELKNKAVITPSLVQLETEDAKKKAVEWFGFDIEVVGDGKYVLAQSPAGGTLVEPGCAKVVIYTTDEALQERRTVKVPNLVGMTAVAANGTLTNLGLNLKISGTTNFASGKGAVVIEQNIAPGETVELGSVIELTFRYLDDSDVTFADTENE